jgi:hypothetical protein
MDGEAMKTDPAEPRGAASDRAEVRDRAAFRTKDTPNPWSHRPSRIGSTSRSSAHGEWSRRGRHPVGIDPDVLEPRAVGQNRVGLEVE